jgi:MarR family transcriptional regulator, lower aerobic nicotinate degradation pathway regulator
MKSRKPKTQTRPQGSLHPAGTRQRARLKDAEVVNFSVDNQVGFLLRVAHQRHNANLAANLNQLNLTPPQGVVLARLLERDRVSQNLLGRLVAMEPANIRDVVLRLKSRGFVRQEKDPGDGRLLLLSLTPRGEALAQQLIHLSVGSVAETLRSLTLREGDKLRELLKKLVAD